jgi:RNA polymerase sigma factor for flagellar operon FliA
VSQGLNQQTAALIEESLPMVRHVVYQVSAHFPRHVDKEELVRAGVLGLVEAAHRFDTSKGVPFPPFAAQRIRGAILDAVRKVDWAPRSLRRAGRTMEATAERLATELHRNPTAVELASALGVTTEALAELQHSLIRSMVLGLDGGVGETGIDGDDDVFLEGTVADDALSVEDELCEREMKSYLHDAIAVLPDRHRTVIQGYFFEGRSSEDLANEFGITVSRVSQIRTEAFEMLRHGIDAQYRDADSEGTEALSRRTTPQRGAYVAAIATRSTFRSRLDAVRPEPVQRLERAV